MKANIQTHPDIDIEDDINVSLRRFSPLKAARTFFKVQSTNGNVKVTGNSGSPQAKRVLLDHIKTIPGVLSIDSNDLYDDETIRLNVGSVIPEGTHVSVQFGKVVLGSKLPQQNQELLQKIGAMAGIRRIVTNYYGVGND